jgi:hypothetical protein
MWKNGHYSTPHHQDMSITIAYDEEEIVVVITVE